MPSPIVVSGATPFYGLNTQYGEFSVNVPPIDMESFRLTMFTVADLGGSASSSTPITITFTGGAKLNDGTTSVQIKKPYGSISFGQIDSNTYIIPLPVIRGNTEPGRPTILVSTPHTVISTVRTISTMDILHDMAMRYANFSTQVFAPYGFQPSVDDPFSGYNFVSAITTRTGLQNASTAYISTLFIETLRTSSLRLDSTFNVSYFENGRISTRSTLVNSFQFPNPNDKLFMSSGQLYLGPNQITQDMQKFVPEFYSSLVGIMITNDNPSPGISSLSTQVSLAPFTFNANPGLSSLNEVIIPYYRSILSESNMSSFNDYLGTLASTVVRCDTGLSSLKSNVDYQLGLTPFLISSFSTLVSRSLSSINEGRTVSSLFSSLVLGLSSIRDPEIYNFRPRIANFLSSTECSVKISSLSTFITQGSIDINLSSPISTLSNDVYSGFGNIGSGFGVSSLSSILGFGLININNSPGTSSMNRVMRTGFSNVNISTPVSTLSTMISHGLSTLVPLSLGISSLANLTSLISTNIYDSGISSLLLEFQIGISTLSLNPGLSSLVPVFNKAWYDISIAAAMSSISTTFGYGIQDTTALISTHIPLSTLFASTVCLQSNLVTPRLFGNLLVSNGTFLVNNSTPQIDASSSARPSSITTSFMNVNTTATFGAPLSTSSFTTQFLNASSITIASNVNTRSTLTNVLTFFDRSNGVPHTLNYSNINLFWRNVSVFDTADPGASSLSSVVGPLISAIALYPDYSRTLSTTFSSIGGSISGLSSLSTLFGTSLKQTNVRTGISTLTLELTDLVVSSITTSFLNISSLFTITTNTSSLYANDVQPLDPLNSFLRCSTFSTGSDSIINNLYVTTLSTNELNVNNITWANINRMETLVPNTMAFSTVRASTIYNSEIYMQNADSSYPDDVPLEDYTHFLLRGSNGNLIYNSTTYLFDNAFDEVTLDTGYVSSVNAQFLYASSMTFTGKILFDRIQVKPTLATSYWLATTGGTGNGVDASGTLWVSEDGIRWYTVDPSPDCWVGRSNNDSIVGSPHYRIATNGEYLLAYSIYLSDSGESRDYNAISYDGLTWSNVPRVGPGFTTPNQQATILWDGNKWWKFIARCNASPGYENGTYTSTDGFTWKQHTWSLTDGSYTGSVWINGNASMAVPFVTGVAYNGTTMVNNTLSVASGSNGSIAFSDDLLNARSLNNGIIANNEHNSVELSPMPWSDGYAWWFPNQFAGTSGSLARIYPWRSNATGISSNDPLTNNSIRYASGHGFNFTATNYSVGAGAFNGHMHVCGQAQRSATLCNSIDQTLLYSYDGLTWFRNPSATGPRGTIRSVTYAQDKWVVGAVGNVNGFSGASNGNSGVSLWYSYDGLNWDSCTDGPFANTYTNLNSYYGGGAEQVFFMSNVKPSLDFNGIRIYNQPGGFTWHNPVSKEQAIHTFQSTFMLHNTLVFDYNTGSNMKVGFCNIKPQTEFDMGGVGTFLSQKINVSSFYVLPSSTNGILTERNLPLSTFNTFVYGSTLVSSLSCGQYDNQSGVFGLTGQFPMFRDQFGGDPTYVKNFLTQTGSSNVVMPPSIYQLSTGMTLYYRSGNTNYRQSYVGTQFFTGQHVVESLDISSAVVKTIVSTVTNDNGVLIPQITSTITDYTGYLISAADEGYLSVYGNGKKLTGCNAIQITEALPKVKFTSTDKDPSVFGVITNNKNQQVNPDSSYMLDSDPDWGNDLYGRIRVNSIGEGALWVTNINGNIENGDYLCSSEISGHARKQDEPELYNYTVAKATISCEFNLNSTQYKCEEITIDGQVYRRAFIGCTYHCG